MEVGFMTVVMVRRLALLGMFVVLFGFQPRAQGSDPVVGTWVLNVAKSKFNPGPAPKNETRTYAVAGSDLKASSKGVDGDGKETSSTWTVAYDGKEQAITGNPDADKLVVKRVDANTTNYTETKAGKVVFTGTRTVSKDGKTLTITTKGTNAKGQKVDDVAVYDKK
jgi:hypothetical protein